MATYIRVFESLDEMIEFGDQCYKAGRQDHHATLSHFVGREFTGWSDVEAKANKLWQDGLDTIRRLADEARGEITMRPKSRKRRQTWSEDSGDEFDTDRFRAGQAPWLECRAQSVTAPQRLTLWIDTSTNAYRNPEEMIWRGAAAVIIADLLEAAGFQVEIFGVAGTDNTFHNGNNFRLAYRMKRHDQPLDMSSLANAVSGWYYRTVAFQAYYGEKSKVRRNLGFPCKLTAEPELVEALGNPVDPIIIADVWNQADAADLVRRIVARFQE